MPDSLTTPVDHAPVDLAAWKERLVARYSTVISRVDLFGKVFELLHPRSADDLLDEAEFDRDERIPYWAEVWPSARMLAEHVIQAEGHGKRLLELGCGIGLASIAGVTRGFDATATDYHEEALEFVRYNALAAGLPGIGVRMVDWRQFPTDLGLFDLVIAGDVLYERPHSALVANAIARSLAPNGKAWITHPNRPPSVTFGDECRQRGLVTTSLGIVQRHQGGVTHTVETLEIRHG